jgi:hypothetical protein
MPFLDLPIDQRWDEFKRVTGQYPRSNSGDEPVQITYPRLSLRPMPQHPYRILQGCQVRIYTRFPISWPESRPLSPTRQQLIELIGGIRFWHVTDQARDVLPVIPGVGLFHTLFAEVADDLVIAK